LSFARVLRTVRDALVHLPLFYKVLIANSAIVLLGALAGTAITLRVATTRPRVLPDIPLTATFAVAGLLLTGLLNALILRAAFRPLARLQEAAGRIRAGDLSARAAISPPADAQIGRIAEALNNVLDEVQRYEGQVQALSGALIRAQEEERQRIARELHDDTGQVLTLLLIRLKLLAGEPGAEALATQIAELRAVVATALDQVRRLALNLRPPTIDQLGLTSAVRSLVVSFTDSTHLDVSLELPGEQVRLDPERTIAVYRIIQEALTNAIKHASARHIQVSLSVQAEHLIVRVRDDGRGFSPQSFTNRASRAGNALPGVGLFGMEERARLSGGTLSISSSPGRGTSVTLRLPIGPDALGIDHE
jgi:two-component system sensor histidine kinase UhpB